MKCFEWCRYCFELSVSHENVYFCALVSMSVCLWSYSSSPGEQTQYRDDKQLSYCVFLLRLWLHVCLSVCVCVCLSYPVSVELSSVSYGLVKKLCCMPKFVFARLFVPLGCPTTDFKHFAQNPAYVAFFWDYVFVFFVRIHSGIIASVIRQTASHPLALFSSSLCVFVTLAILSFKMIFIIIIDIIIN